jgi:Family of unknown function (DUF5677)
MTTDAIRQATTWLSETNAYFAHQAEGFGPIAELTPTGQFVARLGAFGYLQSEAIVILAQSPLPLHLQMGSLVRGMLEAWSKAAWLTQPRKDLERMKRALGYQRESLRQHREKLEYQAETSGPVDRDHFDALTTVELPVLDLMRDSGGARPPPDQRSLMESLGHPERYVFYRWESDSVHVSSTALAQLVGTREGVTLLGVATDPATVITKLAVAWQAVSELYGIVMREARIDPGDWNGRVRGWRSSYEALG